VVSATETKRVHCAVRTVSSNVRQIKFCLLNFNPKYVACSAGSDSVKSGLRATNKNLKRS
jgi:hypothetical protein